MPQPEPKKIAYLFGAGATHAELTNLDPDLLPEKLGLLTSNVSIRVIKRAKRAAGYLKGVQMLSPAAGSLNIELLISLIESSKIHGWEYTTRYIKRLVRDDIKGILTSSRKARFQLHKALLEFHEHEVARAKERVIALVSLNYDDVLDSAYRQYYGKPNYCFSLERPLQNEKIPLLKLHGSFNWSRRKIRGRRRTIEIIPLGASKNYLHAPYGFIWNRALEVLIQCDTLRVIGCSLNPNDVHLIDLLFKAHLERGTPFGIEIINLDKSGEDIQKSYGFLPGIQRLTEIERGLISEPISGNPFKIWLKYKGKRTLKERVKETKYLKTVCK